MPTVSDETLAQWWAEDLLKQGYTNHETEQMVAEWLRLMREARLT